MAPVPPIPTPMAVYHNSTKTGREDVHPSSKPEFLTVSLVSSLPA